MIKKNVLRGILLSSLFSTFFSFKAINKNSATSFEESSSKWVSYLSNVYDNLSGDKKNLSFEVFHMGMVGYYNLKAQNKLSSKNLLTIVDFSLSSHKKRLWIIDISKKKVLYNSLVSHGKNTGNEFAKSFSNVAETHKSSLGFYVTGSTYYGKHDLSLRLVGMDPSFNCKAFERAIVMHGAKYVSESWIQKYGMLGRSFGCPAIPMDISKEVINLLANGTCLFLYYPDKDYQKKSALLDEARVIETFNALDSKIYHLN